MLNGVAHTEHWDQPMVIVLVAIALVAAVGGFIIISNYVMPNIHQFCQTRLATLL